MNRAILLAAALAAPAMCSAATVCRLVSGGSLAFGPYNFFDAAPKDSLVNVTVSCERNGGPQNVSAILRLDQGMNSNSVSARRMAHTGGLGDYLAYGLYRDVGRTAVWGNSDRVDTVNANLNVPNRGTASATFTIYGRIPARQDVGAGSYSDAVQLTLIF